MITYFKNQKDLSSALIKAIDSYWNYELSENDIINYLETVYKKNKYKLMSTAGAGVFNSVIRQRLGKKRINLLIQILNVEGGQNEDN